MRKFTQVKTEKTNTICEQLICDVCKKEAKYPFWEWAEKEGEERRCQVSMTDGLLGQDKSGHVSLITYDICPHCFEAHIVTTFKKLSVEPKIEEIDL